MDILPNKTELTEIQELEWEYHNEHHRYLRWEKHKMEHQYSQLLVYLNSGIFISSSVLVNMYDKIQYKWIITTAWWLSAFSLIFVLVSFLFSIESYKETIDLWKLKRENLNSIYKKFVNICTCISTFLFFLSIISTLIFFTLNFLFMAENTPKTFVESTSVSMQKNSEPVSAGISPTEFFAWADQTWTGK